MADRNWMLLLLAKNKERLLEIPDNYKNWITDALRNFAWSDESQFLLKHLDKRARIWMEHESIDTYCLVSTAHARCDTEIV